MEGLGQVSGSINLAREWMCQSCLRAQNEGENELTSVKFDYVNMKCKSQKSIVAHVSSTAEI